MKWLEYVVLETILLGWDLCILAVIGRLLCSGGRINYSEKYPWPTLSLGDPGH